MKKQADQSQAEKKRAQASRCGSGGWERSLSLDSKDIGKEGMMNLSVEYENRQEDFRVTLLDTIEDAFLVSPVVIDGQVVGFGDECVLRLLYITDGKVYCWDVKKFQVVKASSYGTCYRVELSKDAVEVNRREAYRVFIGEYMDIMYLREKDHVPVRMSVLIRDISETGFCFTTKENYDIGRILKLRIPTEQEVFAPSAQITRKHKPEESVGVFEYGCSFKEENLKLSMYLLRRQRERQKQKLNGKGKPQEPQAAEDNSQPDKENENRQSEKKQRRSEVKLESLT